MTGKHKTRLVGWHPSDPALTGWLDAEIERRGGGRGAQSAILDEALEKAMNDTRLTAADRDTVARALRLAGTPPDGNRAYTGTGDDVTAAAYALGQAKDLLGALAAIVNRLAGEQE